MKYLITLLAILFCLQSFGQMDSLKGIVIHNPNLPNYYNGYRGWRSVTAIDTSISKSTADTISVKMLVSGLDGKVYSIKGYDVLKYIPQHWGDDIFYLGHKEHDFYLDDKLNPLKNITVWQTK